MIPSRDDQDRLDETLPAAVSKRRPLITAGAMILVIGELAVFRGLTEVLVMALAGAIAFFCLDFEKVDSALQRLLKNGSSASRHCRRPGSIFHIKFVILSGFRQLFASYAPDRAHPSGGQKLQSTGPFRGHRR